MNSKQPGTHTSPVEVTNVSGHGIWLLAEGRELFLSYEDFPWFKEVAIGKVLNVEQPTPGHFSWLDFDVDLGLETIEYPKRFPKESRGIQEVE